MIDQTVYNLVVDGIYSVKFAVKIIELAEAFSTDDLTVQAHCGPQSDVAQREETVEFVIFDAYDLKLFVHVYFDYEPSWDCFTIRTSMYGAQTIYLPHDFDPVKEIKPILRKARRGLK